MSSIPKLQMITHASWMSNEMASAGIKVNHSLGVEIPIFSYEDIWWMPQGFAVELNRALTYAGLPLINFTAPGPHLLSQTPVNLTGRTVTTVTVAEMKTNPVEGWWKTAEAKVETFPSRWRSAEQAVKDAQESCLSDFTFLQVSDRTLPIKEEFRSYVIDGKAVTTSIYLQHLPDGTEVTVYDGARTDENSLKRVSDFVTTAMEDMAVPRSFVVDTAVLDDETIVILEYNPTWCSAWYDCDLHIVVEALKIGFEDQKWTYFPDFYMLDKAERRPVLPFHPKSR